MRVISWSVGPLLGTPGRGFHAYIHTFSHTHTHTFTSNSRVHLPFAFLNSGKHRRPHSISLPNGLSQAPPSWTDARGREDTGYGYGRGYGCGYGSGLRRHIHQATSLGNDSSHADYFRNELNALLAALRQGDTLKLYFCLLDLTRGASLDNQSFCRVVQSIPPTTFSEILRNFDPFHISSHVDSAPNIAISWGAAIYSPLGELINKWGVKILYVRILNRLRLLQRARQLPHTDGSPSQIRPLLRDYLVLLRCAGATTDTQVAKTIWWELFADGYGAWKHAELFAEFIKARYLTEALYASNDLARFRVRPLDLHRSATTLSKDVVKKLKRLRAALTDNQPHRFGQNVNEYYFAESLTRLLRKRRPLKRLERRAIIRRMIPGDELLLCAILKANGRNGSAYASNVLMRFWGINISIFKTELGNREISGGHDFPPGSAQAPTEALLDAVVHCYGNMGEVLLAKTLVDFISRRWGIAVPDKVWSDLLDFARIFSTDPANREWRIAGFTNRFITPDTVLDIWELCTQEPHHFQPGMRDYYSLVKSMIGYKRPVSQFVDAIRQLTPLYNRTARQMQVAWAELISTTQQGVPNHAAYRHYRVLQSSKHYLWYCFHYIARQAFKKLNPENVDSADAVRHVPDLVAELGPFLASTVRYRIATGIVDLSLGYGPLRTIETKQSLEKPEALSRRPPQKTWSPVRTHDRTVEMDWDALEKTSNGAASSAALREYMSITSLDSGEEAPKEKDEHVVEEDEEDDAGQENLYVDLEEEAASEQDQPIDEVGDHDEIGDREDMEKRIVVETSRQGRHVQDAFDESHNLEIEPSTAEGPETAPKNESALSGDPFEDAFACHHEDNFGTSSAPQYSQDWEKDLTANAVTLDRRRFRSSQLVERPAYLLRPRYSAPPGQPSLTALREDGNEFTGFHEDPLKAHFAAHRIVRKIAHTPGMPIDLGVPGRSANKAQLVEHLLWVRT